MKFVWISALFFAATACAWEGTFYTIIDGMYERLHRVKTPTGEIVAVGNTRFSEVPIFDMEYNLASYDSEGETKYFGKKGHYFSLDTKEVLTPFELQLNYFNRVLNLEIQVCGSKWMSVREVSSQKKSYSKGCTPKDVYYLHPSIASSRNRNEPDPE